jgi:hypothetical protein
MTFPEGGIQNKAECGSMDLLKLGVPLRVFSEIAEAGLRVLSPPQHLIMDVRQLLKLMRQVHEVIS